MKAVKTISKEEHFTRKFVSVMMIGVVFCCLVLSVFGCKYSNDFTITYNFNFYLWICAGDKA